MTELTSLSPTPRRLFGPGPTNVAPDVLEAMRAPMLGHLDAEFHAILDEVAAMLGEVYRQRSGISIALSGSGIPSRTRARR